MLEACAAIPVGLAAGAASSASAADLTKIRIATAASETSGAAMYAQDLGFFTQAGLAADLAFFQSGAVIVNTVVSGSADFGSSAVSSLALARGSGLPVTIVAAGGLSTGKPISAIIVLKDGPRTAADLTGKTMAVPGLKTFSQYTAQLWIDKNGGDSRSVKFVEMPPAEMSAALESHRVDSATTFEPGITLAMATGNFRVLGNCAAVVAPRWLTSVWFSTDAYVQQNPDATRRFVGAIRQGALWSNSHLAQSSAILAKYTKLDPDLAARMTRDQQGTVLDPALLQPNLDVLARYNALPNPVTVSQLVWNPH
ncbi:MAG: ABC transporter substrate-binding protein [Candidatus Lustribacter sp.]|jgi:NitT/TauT family transport system substrate-binding protein